MNADSSEQPDLGAIEARLARKAALEADIAGIDSYHQIVGRLLRAQRERRTDDLTELFEVKRAISADIAALLARVRELEAENAALKRGQPY